MTWGGRNYSNVSFPYIDKLLTFIVNYVALCSNNLWGIASIKIAIILACITVESKLEAGLD